MGPITRTTTSPSPSIFQSQRGFAFTLQAEMLNAFNHPTFGPAATNGGANFGYNALQSSGFGLSGNTLNPNPNSPNDGARVD